MKSYLVVSFLSLLAVNACTTRTQNQNLTLRVHVPKVKFILDPHRMEDMYSMAIALQLHRGLFRYDPNGEVLPDLVEKWTISNDGLSYRFHLRETTFSDGTKITANHVVQSLARIFFLGAGVGADLEYISGTKLFKTSKHLSDLGIKALNEKLVEIQLSHPSALLLKHLSIVDCAIFPLKRFDDPLSVGSNTPVSGPYRIQAIDSSSVTLKKWRKDVLDSKNPPQELVFFHADYPTEHTANNALNPSTIEIIQNLKTDSLDFEIVSPIYRRQLISLGWNLSVTELVKSWFVIMNPKLIPFTIRKYLYHRVNPAALLTNLKNTQLQTAFGLIPNGMPGALIEPPFLEESLTPASSVSGTFQIQFQKDHPILAQTAHFLKSVWESETLKINLTPLTKSEYLQKMFASQGEIIIGTKGIDYYDGYSELTYFRSGYVGNYFHLRSPTVDRQLDDAVRILAAESRAERYKFIQQAILQEYTVIPLMFGSQGSGLWSPRVKTIPPHPIGLHGLPLETVEMK